VAHYRSHRVGNFDDRLWGVSMILVKTVQTGADPDLDPPKCGHEAQSGQLDSDSIALSRLSEPPISTLTPDHFTDLFGPDGSCVRCGAPPVRRVTFGWLACPHQIEAGMVPNA